MVDPRIFCRQHLLGEHVELHMFVGVLRKGTSVRGYLDHGLLQVGSLVSRHKELAREIVRRGMRHQSRLPRIVFPAVGRVSVEESTEELIRRCEECRERYLVTL